jgi:hypothetical protein
MQPLAEFTITVNGQERPAPDVLTSGTYHREHDGDEEMTEYFVPVQWLQSLPREQAVHETGFFGNQNTVAAPRAASWRSTVDRLKQIFPAPRRGDYQPRRAVGVGSIHATEQEPAQRSPATTPVRSSLCAVVPLRWVAVPPNQQGIGRRGEQHHDRRDLPDV